ncbi:molybdenum ABC transporter ATP-binding protein [Roseibium sp. CAU 1637]|uniref:Molybdenum ABC transporter ATP-binding protein n=1 Tax=Roseibium limicola TaxID=2816037 RepID=A0A939JBA2_9HYPH|nr:molybdenum ABC transporter ATP-binding protein [Roseibium limicola]MBO0347243.1 molybdenum ABC transporter ATP-binding protein [Roseibium limicola]
MLEVDVTGQVGAFSLSACFSGGAGVTALFGQSGAGKTTITNMIAGLVKPTAGRIIVKGEVLFDAAQGINMSLRQRRIGQVYQDARLFPHLTVRSNLTFARWAGGRSTTRSFDEVVGLLGIAELLDRKPAHLSGGERQRVAIGRALLSDPRILLMDEPLASLDQGRKADILPYLDRLRQEAGLPIVYVSHAMEEVARLAETLVIVSGGKVLAHGPVADIMSRVDLGNATGRHEAGALLEGSVSHVDDGWGLAHVDLGQGQIMQIPDPSLSAGDAMRLRIRARDVALSLSPPTGLSIRNVLSGEVLQVTVEDGPYAEVVCAVAGQTLRARITRASAHELGLQPGLKIFMLVKSVAIERRQRMAVGHLSSGFRSGDKA